MTTVSAPDAPIGPDELLASLNELLEAERAGARVARETAGTVIVEIRRGERRIGCWNDPTLRIEAGDRVIAIDANEGR